MRVSRQSAAVALACVGASLALDALMLRHGIVLEDEGATVQIALRLAHGEVLYRDCPINLGPGVYELLALVFRATGLSYVAGRAMVALASAACTLLVWVLARRAGAGAGAFVAPWLFLALRPLAFPQWHMVFYSPLAIACALLALWLGLQPGGAGIALAAGAAAGACGAFKQNYGALAAVSGALALLCVRRRLAPLLPFALGVALPAVLVVLRYESQGAGPDLYQWTVTFAAGAHGHVFHVGLPPPWPTLGPDVRFRAGFLYYVPPLLWETLFPALASGWIWRHTGLIEVALKAVFYLPLLLPPLLVWRPGTGPERDAARGLAAGAALFLWLGSYPSLDWAHLCSTLPYAFACLAVLAGRSPRGRRLLVIALVPASLASAALLGVALARDTVVLPNVGLRVAPGLGEPLLQASRFLQEHGLHRVVVVPYQPGFYHVSGSENATGSDIFLPHFVGERDLGRVHAALDDGTAVVLFRKEYAHLPPFARTFPDLAARLRGSPLATFHGEAYELSIVAPAPRVRARPGP